MASSLAHANEHRSLFRVVYLPISGDGGPMPGARIAIDGLWRCLCPSIDEVTLSRVLQSPSPLLPPLASRTQCPSPQPRPRPRPRPNTCTAQWRARPVHTSSRRSGSAFGEVQALQSGGLTGVQRQDGLNEGQTATVEEVLAIRRPTFELLSRATTAVIYDALRVMLTQPRRSVHLRALVKYLVEQRAQTPNAFLYEALITSNWERNGSAEEVRLILDEMRTLHVGPTSSLYHAALRALAIHPDYLLRTKIIKDMRERWLEITPDGRCSIALGLLREGQHELALDALEDMYSNSIAVPSWVSDIFIFVLGQHGHLDEATALLQRRITGPMTEHTKSSADISANTWAFLLDESSRQFHYAGTRLAWDTCVPTKLINPSDGTCLNVLNTASRYSDARLATEAIELLSARGVRLAAHHHEALVDCHAHRDDVHNALQALCTMAKAGIQPSRASTASLRAAFRRSPRLARAARSALLHLAEEFTVPLAAFNVVLEGLCAYGGGGASEGADQEAFELYQQIRHVCGCGPDVDTFRPFMEKGWSAEISRYMLEEMQAFGVRPTREFYDRLIYVSAAEGDLDGAFAALEELELRSNKGAAVEGNEAAAVPLEEWITQATALAVVRRCVAQRDERLWGLLAFAKKVGLDLGTAGRALVESAEEAKDQWAVKQLEDGEGTRDKGPTGEMPPWLNSPFFGEKATG